MEKLYIVGFGPGDEKLLTVESSHIIKSADRILSTKRIGKKSEDIQSYKLPELMKELEKKIAGNTVVLVSGDCNFFSISKNIVKKFSSKYDIELINGISSIQYFSAKILIPYDDAKIVSMHGRDGQIVPKVSYNKKVFALTGGDYRAHDICRILWECGLGEVEVIVGENLSYDDEKIIKGTACLLKEQFFDDLSVMYIENSLAINPHFLIKDEEFIRKDVPMTKEEVRWLSLQKLGILPSDIVYDIGAGTGSVSIEMARKAFDGFVYAIEVKDKACDLIEENRIKHGAYNLKIINAKAPDGILELPTPQRAFIGGSLGNMDDIVKNLIEKNPDIKIVANAITLQSLNQILDSFNKYGFINIDTICVNIAKAQKVGNYDMMMAQNPVYIITGERLNREKV